MHAHGAASRGADFADLQADFLWPGKRAAPPASTRNFVQRIRKPLVRPTIVVGPALRAVLPSRLALGARGLAARAPLVASDAGGGRSRARRRGRLGAAGPAKCQAGVSGARCRRFRRRAGRSTNPCADSVGVRGRAAGCAAGAWDPRRGWRRSARAKPSTGCTLAPRWLRHLSYPRLRCRAVGGLASLAAPAEGGGGEEAADEDGQQEDASACGGGGYVA